MICYIYTLWPLQFSLSFSHCPNRTPKSWCNPKNSSAEQSTSHSLLSVNKTPNCYTKMKKMVLQLTIEDEKRKRKALKVVAAVEGVDSVAVDMKEKLMTVTGEADPVFVTARLRKYGFHFAQLQSVGPAKDEKKEEKEEEKNLEILRYVYVERPPYDYSFASDENPNACTIC